MNFKLFQRQDLARAALRDGVILSWEPGLGKTLAMYAWPLLKCGLLKRDGVPVRPLCPAAPVLLVATGDLHEQIIKEGLKHFGVMPTLLDSQQTFLKLSWLDGKGRRILPPGFYLSSYTQLSRNGVAPVPEVDFIAFIKNLGESQYYQELDRSVRCVHSPTLSDLCQDAFECAVLDEGVRIKGEDTLIGSGTRQLSPRFRMILTGTPIKNRMQDIFFLAHWVSGGKYNRHELFPYKESEQSRFIHDFGVVERNLSAEKRKGSTRKFMSMSPQICNVYKAWKILAPLVLRRRKCDCGEDLVAKRVHTVRVGMGKLQAVRCSEILRGASVDHEGKLTIGAKLQALRLNACC